MPHLVPDLAGARVPQPHDAIRAGGGETARLVRRERDGVDYFFITHEEFKAGIDQNRFAEWAQVHGNYYGTAKETLESNFKKGFSVLLDIDVQGAALLRQAFPAQCYSIFIAPPSIQELERRLVSRKTETAEVIHKRLKNAEEEMAQSHLFDEIVVNDTLDHAYEKLKTLVQKRLG